MLQASIGPLLQVPGWNEVPRRICDRNAARTNLFANENKLSTLMAIATRPCPWNNREPSVMTQTALRLVDKETMDKQKALDAALTQIERAFGKGSIMRMGSREVVEVDAVSTGSL